MTPETLSIIQTISYLMPLAALIWKAAQQASEIKEIRKDLDDNIDKFCKKHALLEEKIERDKVVTNNSIVSMLESLHTIELKVTQIDTTLHAIHGQEK